jgi:hypothetical protein
MLESECLFMGWFLGEELTDSSSSRSSRRSFTPQGHWLMTSQFDLASFIQTVVYVS